MDYLDFELRVGPADAAGVYPVDVLHSPAGQARGTMRLPFDGPALERHLQGVELAVLRSAGPWRDVGLGGEDRAQPVADFGRQLFEALLSGPVHESFRRSQDRVRSERKGLRLRLRIEAPDLAVLPWEYLYDPAAGDYVCLSSDTPLVRYLAFDRPPEPLLVTLPLAVLCVVASPSDRGQLDAAHERRRVEAATDALVNAGQLTLEWLPGSTARDLQRAMRRGPFHVLHFVGHGGFDQASGEGVVALTEDDGRTALLSATQLGRLLADHDALRLVVLNACLGARGSRTDVFSSTAATLVRRGVPAVVAMQYEISDGAAIEFARALYEALADGCPVDAAVSEARKAVSLAARRGVEWGTPVLHMRSPDGVLFRVDPAGGPARRTTNHMRVPNVGVPPRPTPRPAPASPPGPDVAERVRALRARLLMATDQHALQALAYEADALRAAYPLSVETRRLQDQLAEALRATKPGSDSTPVSTGGPPRRRGPVIWGAGAAGLAASVLLGIAVVRSQRGDVTTPLAGSPARTAADTVILAMPSPAPAPDTVILATPSPAPAPDTTSGSVTGIRGTPRDTAAEVSPRVAPDRTLRPRGRLLARPTTDSSSYVGGIGGTQFSARCDDGDVLVGFEGRQGAPGNARVFRLKGLCGSFATEGLPPASGAARVLVKPSDPTTAVGSMHGAEVRVTCPANSFVARVELQAAEFSNGQSSYIASVVASCAEAIVASDGAIRLVPTGFLPRIGQEEQSITGIVEFGQGEVPFTRTVDFRCPGSAALSGFGGRGGGWIEALGWRCSDLRVVGGP